MLCPCFIFWENIMGIVLLMQLLEYTVALVKGQ